jgi:hypothetical protein
MPLFNIICCKHYFYFSNRYFLKKWLIKIEKGIQQRLQNLNPAPPPGETQTRTQAPGENTKARRHQTCSPPDNRPEQRQQTPDRGRHI